MNTIMKWGGWAAAKNAERYVARNFGHDPLTHDFWDWLYTDSFTFLPMPEAGLSHGPDDETEGVFPAG